MRPIRKRTHSDRDNKIMRTAESWLEEMLGPYKWDLTEVKIIEAVQADALKEAAEIADRFGARSLRRASPIEIRDAILKRAREIECPTPKPKP